MMLRSTIVLTLLATTEALPSRCGTTDVVGYSDWGTLQADIDALESGSESTQFTICPGTTFKLEENSEGLRFDLPKDVGPVLVKCGESGSFVNACTIVGGLHHIWITEVGPLTFQGLTFEEATRGSVWTGLGMEEISFSDCTWKENAYSWDNTGGAPCPTGCAGAVSGKDGGATSFVRCQFYNNSGDSGAVFGEDMNYSFDQCKFEGNTGTVSTKIRCRILVPNAPTNHISSHH